MQAMQVSKSAFATGTSPTDKPVRTPTYIEAINTLLRLRHKIVGYAIKAAILFVVSCDVNAQTPSSYIVVDQFGYLPDAAKIAVIRNPQTGFDAPASFSPGGEYAVIDAQSGDEVFAGSISAWNDGATDASSGDKAWWFDFSQVTEPGNYYVLDKEKNVRSFTFSISKGIYNDVLKQAVRTFFYQRAGFEKVLPYAEEGWTDGASHVGPLQDKNARVYNQPGNASTEMDVHGGWYDAGDYNKYTNWTANYVVDFMHAYLDRPGAWGDDYNIPESGNGVPDLLDEAMWGIDFLLRMQKDDGSVLSIVGLASASPPSGATGPSLYGTPSTSSTLNSAAAYAIASKAYGSTGMTEYAQTLETAAIKAWDWAEANPDIIFKNNDAASGTSGLGAGQQETDDYGRLVAKLKAANFLFDITGETAYRDFFDANYQQVHLLLWNFAYPFELAAQEVLLDYTKVPGATTSVVNQIKTVYENTMLNGSENFIAYYNSKDPYRAHIQDYTWGSNSVKSAQGLMYLDIVSYDIDPGKEADATEAAAGYIHYLNGVNPLNMTYLSNMYHHGAERSVNEFYHSWFTNGSAKWDRVGVSTYGPPPGFLTGGPNPGYDWDGCCPDGCGGSGNNAVCTSEALTPPKGQPKQKSYKDFNTGWPLNSWSVTENSCGYQINYIRLLSAFVDITYDCAGVKNGEAIIDACGNCAGGNTGLEPATDPSACGTVTAALKEAGRYFNVFPNPTPGRFAIQSTFPGDYDYTVTNVLGKKIDSDHKTGDAAVDLSTCPSGIYLLLLEVDGRQVFRRILKR